MVSLLLTNGGNILLETEDKCVPLHLAAKKGSLDCVKILLEHAKEKGYANYRYSADNKKWTALHYAAFHGHKDVVYYLLYWDADYDQLRGMKNSRNKTAYEIVTNQEVKHSFNSIIISRYLELYREWQFGCSTNIA